MRVTKTAFFAVLAASSVQAAHAQTQMIATPLNANVINLLNPFSTLLGTPTISQNLTTAISINNNSTTAQRNQAIIDNTITTDNGVVLSDGWGTRLNSIWRANNSQAANGTTVTFSNNLLTLFRQINAISQDDSGKAKNWFADGSANGTVFISNANLALGRTATSNTAITGISLPAGGVFNVYDRAYAPVTNPNRTGNSRPVQVNPGSISTFSAPNYFGITQSNTDLVGGVNGNTGSGLFANASFPSGHTTFGYTTSILMAMIIPERYSEMMTRASEYGTSRVVLGVHYPLDVIGGRVIGTYDVVQMLNNNPQYTNATVNGVFGIGDVTTTSNYQSVFVAARDDVRNLLTSQCGMSIAACIASGAPDRFSNLEQNRADYRARLNYGLPSLSFAQAPREAAPAGGPDASILLATLYGGDTAAARVISPNGGLFGSLRTSTINQIIINTEVEALAAFYGTPLSYWARLDLFSAATYFQGITGTLTLDPADVVTTNVTVANGGTLAGTGTVANTTVASGGALQPGAGAPGTLRINGNLAFQSGALYIVQISQTATSQGQVSGSSSLAGTVRVTSPTGAYRFGSSTILTSNGVSGTFSSVLTPTGINGSLSYASSGVTLNLTSALGQLGGLSGNQAAVGAALDRQFNSLGATAAQGLIFSGDIRQNLTQAAGQAATGTQQTSFDVMNSFMGSLSDQAIDGRGVPIASTGAVTSFAEEDSGALSYTSSGKRRSKSERDAYAAFKAPPRPMAAPQPWSVWAAGYGGTQTTDGDPVAGTANIRSRVYGGVTGLDYRFSPDTIVGFALGGAGTDYNLADNLGHGRSDVFQAGVYGRHTFGPTYIAGALAYGWQDVTTDRTVMLNSLRANFDTNAISGRLEGGYRYATGLGFLTPYAAGQFVTLMLPNYTEQLVAGVNNLALAYQSKDVTASRSEFGLRGDTAFAVSDAIVTLRGRAAWAHNFNTDRSVSTFFQSMPLATFVVNGAAQAHDTALVSAGAEARWINGFSVAATFEGEFSNVTESYAGKGTIRYQW